MNDLDKRYFNWLCGIVGKSRSYGKLLRILYDTPFVYSIPMDANRYEDGIALRYKFGDRHGIPEAIIASELDTSECSILEMMVALSINIESNIMSDDDFGDRTGSWFWTMINSLGLTTMVDKIFDPDKVNRILYVFQYRQYSPNGKGGLFTIKNPISDLRNTEIWMQAMWYLDEVLGF